MLESLNSSEFQQISDETAREVLGGLADDGTYTTYDGRCILDGQAVKDYSTDVYDEIDYII